MADTIVFCLSSFLIVMAIFGSYRIKWLTSEREKLRDADIEKYRLLPSFSNCFDKFWIWDINKFLPENEMDK